jgi:hypothetical protein
VPRLTAEQWAIARAKFEADPLIRFEDLGKEFGVSKQAIQKRAGTEGWVRQSDGLAQRAIRAHARADKLMQTEDIQPRKVLPKVDQQKVDGVKVDGRKIDEIDRSSISARAVAEAEEPRAKVLARHRVEADAPRKVAYAATQSSDYEKAKLAKMLADTFKVIHEIERKAWALDAAEATPPGQTNNTVVVIERTAAPAGRVIDSTT